MSASGSSGWRRYSIFISSTFKDMDFERDIIKTINRLAAEAAREAEQQNKE